MANIKNFKLLRNETALTSRAAAVSALEGLSLPTEEGTLVLARYTENSTPGSVLGIVNLDGSVTVLDLSGEIQDAIQALDSTLTLSGTAAQDAHFTQVAIVDGMLNPSTSSGSNIDIAHIVDYSAATAQSTLALATTDTIAGALAKIEAYILSLDKTASAETGKVLTTVAQADGKVSETKANVIDLALTGYSKESASTGAVTGSDDIQTAISKLENGIAAAAEAATVDGKTIVVGSDGLETAVDIVYVPAVPASGNDPAVPAKIELQDNTGATLSSIDVSNIIGNGFLKSSSYAPATGILTLVFNEGGTDVSYNIDLGALFDYEDIIIKSDSTDYLSWSAATPSGDTSQAQLGVKLASVTYTAATQSTPASLTVDQTNGKVVNGDAITAVKNYVDAKDAELKDAIDDLDAVAVTSGTVNGVVGTGTVTNNTLDLTVAGNNVPLTGYTALTPGSTAETVSIAATDTTNQAIAKLEKAVNSNEAVVAAALNDLDTTKIDVISVNGVQSKTPATGDVVASVTIDGGDVDLTGYTKPASTSAIAATDSVNEAIGKLEKGLENAVAGGVQSVVGGEGIAVDNTDSNNPVVNADIAASNGTSVAGAALVNPIAIDANDKINFAETLDAGYYAIV
jgi:hypothetical protein